MQPPHKSGATRRRTRARSVSASQRTSRADPAHCSKAYREMLEICCERRKIHRRKILRGRWCYFGCPCKSSPVFERHWRNLCLNSHAVTDMKWRRKMSARFCRVVLSHQPFTKLLKLCAVSVDLPAGDKISSFFSGRFRGFSGVPQFDIGADRIPFRTEHLIEFSNALRYQHEIADRRVPR
jgi:hypothetical protein